MPRDKQAQLDKVSRLFGKPEDINQDIKKRKKVGEGKRKDI